MINAFILTEPGKPDQRFEFNDESEFEAIRALHKTMRAAVHRYAQIVLEREIEGFDVPAKRQLGLGHSRPELSFSLALQVCRGQVSRREFARGLRVSESRLAHWEAGLVVPPEKRVQELCETLPGLGELMRGERRAG